MTKDAINIGIFTAIYVVVVFATGMLGVVNPLFMFVGYALGIIANGVVIALLKERVPRFGALAVLGFLMAGVMVLTGHPAITLVIAPLLGLAGDALYRLGGQVWKIVGYAVVSVWYVVPWFPVFVDPEGYYDYISTSMTTEYADSLRWFLSPMMIVGWGVAVFLIGLVGGYFGQSVLKRHFRGARSAL